MVLRYKQACQALGLRFDRRFYDILKAAYEQPGRFYHNWGHVESVLYRIDHLAPLVASSTVNVDAVRMAAFYHDAVYIPGFALNESLSADMATSHLSHMGGSIAARWIMATKNHQPESQDLGAALLCDADLYGLATEDYAINALNVRREFGGDELPEEDWRDGRIKFLETYLGHERLFHLPTQDDVEVRARANMERELATLS